jgi:hypothetical protein
MSSICSPWEIAARFTAEGGLVLLLIKPLPAKA